MPISLTKEEFLERFVERHKLFTLAVNEDIKKMGPFRYKYNKGESESKDINIDMHEPVTNIVADALFRMIDLVYLDE